MKTLLLLLVCSVSIALSFDATKYTNSQELISNAYWLYWKVDLANEEMNFAVRVNTRGWVGFGISASGGMVGSDVAVGWINRSGTAVLTDRFILQKAEPFIDAHQDWILVSGEETNSPSQTILEFKRKFKTCDTTYDLDIVNGTNKVVAAYSDDKPLDDTHMGTKHAQKVSTFITFFGTPEEPIPEENTTTYDMIIPNVLIPDDEDTTYYCIPFAVPSDQTYHIIEYNPLLDNVARVHHYLMFACQSQPNMTHGRCQDIPQNDCHLLIYGWAVGGGSFKLPKDLGVPIGPTYAQYVLLQVHYDNPDLLSGQRDSSGVRIKYTPHLRSINAGMFTTGRAEEGIAIPPNMQNFEVIADCTPECTTSLWPPEGINVIATILHTHLLGRQIWTQVIRDGTEVDPLASQMHYDFNYQEFQLRSKPFKLYPGDRLLTHCVYDSTSRSTVTHGGLGTRSEMCYDFFLYYPMQPRAQCVDITDPAGTQSSRAVFCSGSVIPKAAQSPPFIALPPPPPRTCPAVENVEVAASSHTTIALVLLAICNLLLLL